MGGGPPAPFGLAPMPSRYCERPFTSCICGWGRRRTDILRLFRPALFHLSFPTEGVPPLPRDRPRATLAPRIRVVPYCARAGIEPAAQRHHRSASPATVRPNFTAPVRDPGDCRAAGRDRTGYLLLTRQAPYLQGLNGGECGRRDSNPLPPAWKAGMHDQLHLYRSLASPTLGEHGSVMFGKREVERP